VNSSRDEQLRRLADAYQVDATPKGIADAILDRTSTIPHGENEENSVIDIVEILVRDEGTLAAYVAGTDEPFRDEMLLAAGSDSPSALARTLAELLVEIVIKDVVVVLRTHESPPDG
jgi:hypothetical protein